MSCRARERVDDVLTEGRASEARVARGDLEDPLVFDAVRMRLLEIGEAIKDLEPALLDRKPQVPWRDVARLRDYLAHRSTPSKANGSSSIYLV